MTSDVEVFEEIDPPAAASSASVPRRRVRAPQLRRAALLDAAERLFIEKGVAATTVDDITAAAQVAKGTFYVYFPSWDALLFALLDRFILGFCEHARRAMARHRADNWDARLRTWFKTALDWMLGQLALHDMLFHDIHRGDRDLMKDTPVIAQLSDLLREGTAAGCWRVADPRAVATMMFYAMHGLADEAVVQGTAGRRAHMVRLLMQTFAGALRPLP